MDAEVEMEIHPSALRHGVSKDEIRHAWARRMGPWEPEAQEPRKWFWIGFNFAGLPVELFSLVLPDKDLIIHAQAPLRPQFNKYLREATGQ
jgi:hypothetical protein